jgi:hypothetical protein
MPYGMKARQDMILARMLTSRSTSCCWEVAALLEIGPKAFKAPMMWSVSCSISPVRTLVSSIANSWC